MNLIDLLIVLVIAGVLVYVFNVLVPMDSRFKNVINAIIGLIVFVWILQALGVHVPYLRVKP